MTESELRRRYPAAFNDERKPLKVGIDRDMPPPAPRRALRAWVNDPIYIANLLKPGATRIDLQGNEVAAVTEGVRVPRLKLMRFRRVESVKAVRLTDEHTRMCSQCLGRLFVGEPECTLLPVHALW
jgi:sRNA-binding protein